MCAEGISGASHVSDDIALIDVLPRRARDSAHMSVQGRFSVTARINSVIEYDVVSVTVMEGGGNDSSALRSVDRDAARRVQVALRELTKSRLAGGPQPKDL